MATAGPAGDHYVALISSFSFGSNENATNAAKVVEYEIEGSPSKEDATKTDIEATDVQDDCNEKPNFN